MIDDFNNARVMF